MVRHFIQKIKQLINVQGNSFFHNEEVQTKKTNNVLLVVIEEKK